MRKKQTGILLFCCLITVFHISANAQQVLNSINNKLTVTAGPAIRKTNFRWSIAGNIKGQEPNIFSEIIFNPVYSTGFSVGASYKLYNKLSLAAHYNHLYTYKGSATDFDYEEDNRTSPTTELYLSSNKGNQSSADALLTYDIFNTGIMNVSTAAGYSYTKEVFYLLNDDDPNLQTTYTSKWNGPGLYVNAIWKSWWPIYLGTGVGFQLLKYNAAGNWNLIEEFEHPVSFTQKANANGWDYYANVGYALTDRIHLQINWLHANWRTAYGIDKLYLKNGETPETRFNGAFRKTSGWRLSANFNF